MAQTTSPNPNATNEKAASGFKMPNVDFNALMDSYKKNLEILLL